MRKGRFLQVHPEVEQRVESVARTCVRIWRRDVDRHRAWVAAATDDYSRRSRESMLREAREQLATLQLALRLVAGVNRNRRPR